MYHGCNDSYGTFSLFTVDKDLVIQQPTSQFFASQLINLEWVQPGNGSQQVFPAASDVADEAGNMLVTSYALLRPDGQWSLMLINKDQWNPHPVRIAFRNEDESKNTDAYFSGPVTLTTFGRAQYQWHPTEKGGFAEPDGPAAVSTVTAAANTLYSLPPASITVVRGNVGK
jgi:hypothetical protein